MCMTQTYLTGLSVLCCVFFFANSAKKKAVEEQIDTLTRSLAASKADRRENEREQKLVIMCAYACACACADAWACVHGVVRYVSYVCLWVNIGCPISHLFFCALLVFPQSEATLQLKRLFPGVRGRLVDLCRPTHQRYATAVSIGLGKNMVIII